MFQIAFLLFNIVAISATDNLKLRPQKVQIQWSQYFNREKGIVEDVQFTEMDASGNKVIREIKAYEQRSDFLEVSDMADQELMSQIKFWTDSSEKMEDAAKTIIDNPGSDDEKIKFAGTLPTRTEATKAQYAVTFIGLSDEQVVTLMNVFPDTDTRPKLITGEVRLERHLEKVVADIVFEGIGDRTSTVCTDMLKEHLDEHFKAHEDAKAPAPKWMITEDALADILQKCADLSVEEAKETAKYADDDGDGQITTEELASRFRIQKHVSRKTAATEEERDHQIAKAESEARIHSMQQAVANLAEGKGGQSP